MCIIIWINIQSTNMENRKHKITVKWNRYIQLAIRRDFSLNIYYIGLSLKKYNSVMLQINIILYSMSAVHTII